jgi:hypothetical protein
MLALSHSPEGFVVHAELSGKIQIGGLCHSHFFIEIQDDARKQEG